VFFFFYYSEDEQFSLTNMDKKMKQLKASQNASMSSILCRKFH